jgi:hypothetical protein
VTKIVASVRNKGKLQHWRKNYQLFTLRVFVLRDDFSERINRVIRGFAVFVSNLVHTLNNATLCSSTTPHVYQHGWLLSSVRFFVSMHSHKLTVGLLSAVQQTDLNTALCVHSIRTEYKGSYRHCFSHCPLKNKRAAFTVAVKLPVCVKCSQY